MIGGYGWSAFSDQLQDLSNGPGSLFFGLSPKGGFGGGQIGYNWQAGNFVFGLEADAQARAIRDQFKWTLATSTSKLDWFGTVRGRAGFAVDRVLFFATGGWAYGHVANSEIGGIAYTSNADSSGYALAGGIEYALTNNWSVKGESQYLIFGRHDPTTVTGVRLGSFPGVIVCEDAFHTVSRGYNYRFGGPVVAKY